MTSTIQVAIDGPAGAGKSSVAKALAKRLNYIYLDTGAMYRAVTYQALKEQIPFDDLQALYHLVTKIELHFQEDAKSGQQQLFCNGENISEAIRTSEVSDHVSAISMIPCIREAMVKRQREIADDHNVIMDGRDIGTVVLPKAQYKFFLTASLEERTRRRYKELLQRGDSITYEALREKIFRRDQIDSERENAPLIQAADAILIDTSFMDFSEVVEKLFSIITK